MYYAKLQIGSGCAMPSKGQPRKSSCLKLSLLIDLFDVVYYNQNFLNLFYFFMLQVYFVL